jgi:phosphoglycerol geranylgeranyltransferase
MRAGKVGRADPIRRDEPETAVGYALAAQMLGMRMVYLEAGSGAPNAVPAPMVRAVRQAIDIPLVVGGGIRAPDAARRIARAGADIVVTGTVVERSRGSGTLKAIIDAVKAV